jgi:hypothetical protein
MLTSVKNAIWVNQEKTQVHCDITISLLGSNIFPVLTSAHSTEPDIQKLYQELVSGVWGPIAEPVQPLKKLTVVIL